MNSNLNRRIVRFTIAGIIATIIHFLIAISLIRKQILIPPLANGAAFIGATVTSYLINTLWSFSREISKQSLLKFFLVSLIGFFLAILISGIADSLGMNSTIGIALVVVLVTPATFTLHNFWTYK